MSLPTQRGRLLCNLCNILGVFPFRSLCPTVRKLAHLPRCLLWLKMPILKSIVVGRCWWFFLSPQLIEHFQWCLDCSLKLKSFVSCSPFLSYNWRKILVAHVGKSYTTIRKKNSPPISTLLSKETLSKALPYWFCSLSPELPICNLWAIVQHLTARENKKLT